MHTTTAAAPSVSKPARKSASSAELIVEIVDCAERVRQADRYLAHWEDAERSSRQTERLRTARRAYNASQKAFRRLVRRIAKSRVRSWEDVGVRAELVRHFRGPAGDDSVEWLAVDALINAALAMAGRPPLPREFPDDCDLEAEDDPTPPKRRRGTKKDGNVISFPTASSFADI